MIALCFSDFWKYRFPEKPTRENKTRGVNNISLPRFELLPSCVTMGKLLNR